SPPRVDHEVKSGAGSPTASVIVARSRSFDDGHAAARRRWSAQGLDERRSLAGRSGRSPGAPPGNDPQRSERGAELRVSAGSQVLHRVGYLLVGLNAHAIDVRAVA